MRNFIGLLMVALFVVFSTIASVNAAPKYVATGDLTANTGIVAADTIAFDDVSKNNTDKTTVENIFASAANVGAGTIVDVGALDGGSVTDGFGSIDTGADPITTTGDISGGTHAATSDTSAGDNSSMGYTATEGLVLTGQGSTYDIVIKNDADAIVWSVSTGGTDTDTVGTSTASNFTPDGDTTVGVTAAFGYTATEGAILTGQGSTSDVTIKNDADATVATVPTGTTNLSLSAGTIIVADGGTVTQATDKTTGVTLSTHSGQITTDNASLAAGAEATFTVTNTIVTALDVICISIADSPDADSVIDAFITDVGAGTYDITLSNVSANEDTGAIVINVVVLRGASS